MHDEIVRGALDEAHKELARVGADRVHVEALLGRRCRLRLGRHGERRGRLLGRLHGFVERVLDAVVRDDPAVARAAAQERAEQRTEQHGSHAAGAGHRIRCRHGPDTPAERAFGGPLPRCRTKSALPSRSCTLCASMLTISAPSTRWPCWYGLPFTTATRRDGAISTAVSLKRGAGSALVPGSPATGRYGCVGSRTGGSATALAAASHAQRASAYGLDTDPFLVERQRAHLDHDLV